MEYIPDNLLAGWDVVIIDDEEDSLEVAEILLTEYGATVHTAENGQQALQRVHDVQPRFVISDLSMPELDGWGFVKALKSDPKIQTVPVIALTAHAMRGDAQRALEAGFNDYLTKPLTVDTFMQDLVKLLLDMPELVQYLNI